MTSPSSLDPGLYELLVTTGLRDLLERTEAGGFTSVTTEVDTEFVKVDEATGSQAAGW